MPSENLQDIIKRYKFAGVATTQWQDPFASVLPYRGGGKFTVSPQAMAKAYTPVYRYPINPPKPPKPIDDEVSDSEGDEDDKDGKHDFFLQNEKNAKRLFKEVIPTDVDILPSNDDTQPTSTSGQAAIPEEGLSQTGDQVTDVAPPPTVEDDMHTEDTLQPDDTGLVSEEPAALLDEAQIDDTPPLVDNHSTPEDTQPPEDLSITADTTPSDDSSKQEDSLAIAEPATAAMNDEEAAEPILMETPGDAAGEPVAGDDTQVSGDQPATTEQPADPSADTTVIMSEECQEDPSPPPPAPDPPTESSKDLTGTIDIATEVPDEPPAPQSPHVDKKVSFAPGTQEPAPTIRKKKGSAGGKKKKRKQNANHTNPMPDDIVAIVDEGAAQLSADDIVVIIEESVPQMSLDDIVAIIDEGVGQPIDVDAASQPPPIEEPLPALAPEDALTLKVDVGTSERAVPSADNIQAVGEPESKDNHAESPATEEIASTDSAPGHDPEPLAPAESTAGSDTKSTEPASDNHGDKSKPLSVKDRVAMFENPPATAAAVGGSSKPPDVASPVVIDESSATTPEARDPTTASSINAQEALVDDTTMPTPPEVPAPPLEQDDDEGQDSAHGPAPDTVIGEVLDGPGAQEAEAEVEDAEQVPDQPDSLESEAVVQGESTSSPTTDAPVETETAEIGPEVEVSDQVLEQCEPVEAEDAEQESIASATTDGASCETEAEGNVPEYKATEQVPEQSDPPESGEAMLPTVTTDNAPIEADAPANEPAHGEAEQVVDEPDSSQEPFQDAQVAAVEIETTGEGANEPAIDDTTTLDAAGDETDADSATVDAQEPEAAEFVAPGNWEGVSEDNVAPFVKSEEPAAVGVVDVNDEVPFEPPTAAAEDDGVQEDAASQVALDVDPAVSETQEAPPDVTKNIEPSTPKPRKEEAEISSPPQSTTKDRPAPSQPEDASKDDLTLEEEPHPEPAAAPHSPALSKDSSKRKQEAWTRHHKASAEISKPIDHSDTKRRHRSTRTSRGEDRYRSHRPAMTPEEDAERQRRRRARKAEEERKRADEEREKLLHAKIEKAALKAAAEEARKLVREKEEEKERKRARRRRDSVLVRDKEVDNTSPSRRIDSSQPQPTSPKLLHRPTLPIPKALTDTNGESFTRAGLLVRTSTSIDAHRASGGSAPRHRREREPKQQTSSPLLYEVSAPRSGKGERSRRLHRSGHGGERTRERSDVPRDVEREGAGSGSRHSSKRYTEGSLEGKEERPRRSSRRESERRERRPVVREEKKTSFLGSLMRAFK
jgi:hypothetical protein